MDDISLRNHVDSLRFHEDMDRTKLFIKMLILFEKHATAIYSANGNNHIRQQLLVFYACLEGIYLRSSVAQTSSGGINQTMRGILHMSTNSC